MKIGRKMFTLAAIAIASLAIGAGARAQSTEAPAPPPPPDQNVFYQRIGPGPEMGMGGSVITFEGFEGELGGKTVTGAPFTATISNQTSQTLADGNHIQRNSTGTFARDSQGRIRRDMTLPAIGPWAVAGKTPPHVVFITDPVAGVRYMLNADEKTAMKMPLHGKEREMDKNGKNKFFMMRRTVDDNSQAEATTASLGTQTMDGVTAEGTRITRTIPAGQIGNEKPIVSVTERWYSPELQAVVMTKHSDPRMGERIFQLTDIQRVDPDASLFQVPSDYTVKEGGPMGRHHHRGMPPQSPDAAPASGSEPPPPPSPRQ